MAAICKQTNKHDDQCLHLVIIITFLWLRLVVLLHIIRGHRQPSWQVVRVGHLMLLLQLVNVDALARRIAWGHWWNSIVVIWLHWHVERGRIDWARPGDVAEANVLWRNRGLVRAASILSVLLCLMVIRLQDVPEGQWQVAWWLVEVSP